MESVWDILWLNLVSDLLFTVLLAGLLMLAAGLFLKRQRRKVFRFFDLGPHNPRLNIFVSRVEVRRGGTEGTDGLLARGYEGPALVQPEYEGAQAVGRLVQDPLLEVLPNPVRRLLARYSDLLADVEVEIEVSPDDEERAREVLLDGPDAVVLLGSDVYNRLVRRAYESPRSFVRLVVEEGDAAGEPFRASNDDHAEPTFAVEVEQGRWDVIPARGRNEGPRDIGTVQRITLKSGRRLVMCAGISATATYRSCRYLMEKWQELHEDYGDKDFLVVLAMEGRSPGELESAPISRLRGYSQP